MRRYIIWFVAMVLTTTSVRAEAPPKVVKETWDAAYLEGVKCGSFRSITYAVDRDEQKLFHTSLMMDFRIRRYNAIVPLRMESGDDETADGKVQSLFWTQFLDKGGLTQTGIVKGNELIVGVKGQKDSRHVKWDATVVGLHKQESLFRDHKVKPGDHFTYRNYEPMLLMPVTVRVAVKNFEEVDILVPKKDGEKTRAERQKKKLLRVESETDKVEINGSAVPLPRLVSWLDNQLETVRSEMDQPGLGTITLYRTTKDIAEEEGAAPMLMPDLGLNTLIPLNKAIQHPYDAAAIVYRVTVKGDDDPSTTFVRDARQQASDVKGSAFTLTVHASQVPSVKAEAGAPKEEFSQSSYFIDSNNELVRKLAAEAVGNEIDAWQKAERIEKWVHKHMKGSNAVGFVPASQIARDLQGDCRQHAMLTAALCRAAGVPARTAVGLVYVNDPDRGPVLGFHMWTEVWARGQWLGIDATLGRGSIGPTHLKIADASWHNMQTLAPLLPVTRVMGKLAVEVTRVEGK